MTSLIEHIKAVKVSSTLNGDIKQFGKRNMFDGNDETCWNSSQGKPQSILITFKTPVQVKEVHIMFQGGFVGKDCQFLVAKNEDDELQLSNYFFPKDANHTQVFTLEYKEPISKLKIVFTDSTDFFGRITIYKLDILG